MDFGRRHKFPGSEIKDVIFMAQQAAKASDYLYQLPKPQFPNGNEERAKWHLHMGGVVSQESSGNLNLL